MTFNNAQSATASYRVTVFWALVLFLALTFAGSDPLLAQSSSATLVGTVLDSTGGLLSGADLLLVNVETSVQRRASSDSDGGFTFTTLLPGRYSLRASLTGFTPVELREVVLNVDDRVAVRIELSVASRDESVTVVAEPQRVNRSPAVGTVVDRQFVANMPLNGRTFQSLLTLAPGVTQNGAAGQFNVNGQRANTNYFTVDGVSVNAAAGVSVLANSAGVVPMFTALGTTTSMVSVDALQEFRIQTSTYAPEFGRMTGGQISMVTRAGTNTFHGSVFDYFRDEALDANNWFVNNRGLEKPELRQHNFGGVLGGPIVTGHTFFFGSYEGLRLKQPRALVLNVPTLELRRMAAPSVQSYLNGFPIPNGRELGNGVAEFAYSTSDPSDIDSTSVRVDHHVGASWKFFGRFSHGPSHSAFRTLNSLTTGGQDNRSVTTGATWFLSNRAVHDVRVSYTTNRGSSIRQMDDFGGAVPWPSALTFGPGRDINNIFFSFNLSGCCTAAVGSALAFEQRQINVVDSITFVTNSHEWKVGFDFRRSHPAIDAGSDVSLALRVTPASSRQGQADQYSATIRDLAGRSILFDNVSVYAQDHWKLMSRLTLTYGVRWEFVPPTRASGGPQPATLENMDDPYGGRVRLAPQGTPLWKTRYDSLAPRLGASYLLRNTPDAQLVLKGGAGLFYDVGFGSIGNAFINYPFVQITAPTMPMFPLTPELLAPGFTAGPPTNIIMMNRQLVTPRTYQWNASAEQSLGPHQTLTIGYVGASGRKLLKTDRYNVNLVDSPTVRTEVFLASNRGFSDYHALQIQFQRRLHRGLQAQAAYTWGRSRDTASSDGATTVPAERLPPEMDYGYSDYDLRHVFNVAMTYQTPDLAGGSLLRTLGRDWGFDVMLRTRSGYPINITTRVPFPPETQSVRPNVVPGQPFWIDDVNTPGGRRLNPNAFVAPAPETQGNLPRGAVRGFSATQIDAALRREFRPTDRIRLQLRFEVFNLLNTPFFLDPTGTLADGNFGRSTTTLNNLGGLNAVYQVGGPRSSQMALKVLF